MQLSVRALVDGDIAETAALAADVFRFAYSAAFDDPHGFESYVTSTFDKGRFAADMQDQCAARLVGYCDGRLAGMLKLGTAQAPAFLTDDGAVELAKLYVLEAFHGTGIARRLLDEAVDVAVQSGYRSMWLCVWENNLRAQTFYRNAGFDAVGEVVIPMNGVPFRDLVMRRDV